MQKPELVDALSSLIDEFDRFFQFEERGSLKTTSFDRETGKCDSITVPIQSPIPTLRMERVRAVEESCDCVMSLAPSSNFHLHDTVKTLRVKVGLIDESPPIDELQEIEALINQIRKHRSVVRRSAPNVGQFRRGSWFETATDKFISSDALKTAARLGASKNPGKRKVLKRSRKANGGRIWEHSVEEVIAYLDEDWPSEAIRKAIDRENTTH